MDNWQVVLNEIVKIDQSFDNPIAPIQKKRGTTIAHKFLNQPYHKRIIQYAYDIWWLDFVKMIECENWSRNINLKTKYSTETSYWFCQMNTQRNSDIIFDKRFMDWKRQLDQCLILWNSNHNLFHWPTRKNKQTNWMYCKDYVDDRFSFY